MDAECGTHANVVEESHMTVTKNSASLHVSEFGNAPDVISDLLHIKPTISGVKGAPRLSLDGRPRDGVNLANFWRLTTSLDYSGSINAHLADVLDQLDSASVDLSRLPAGTEAILIGTTIQETVGIPDIDFDPILLGQRSKLGVKLRVGISALER
jgi:Domain of unknown function (DUF4279)